MNKVKIFLYKRDPLKYEINSLTLILDNWNDYGYQDLFRVKFLSKDGRIQDLGKCRIVTNTLAEELDEDEINKLNKEDSFSENVLSLGTSIDFYKNLYKAIESTEEYKDVLKRLRDISERDVLSLDESTALVKGDQEGKVILFKDLDKTLFRFGERSIYDLRKKFDNVGIVIEETSINEIVTNNNLLKLLEEYITSCNNPTIEEYVYDLVSQLSESIVANSNSGLVEFLRVIGEKYSLNIRISQKVATLIPQDNSIDVINQNVEKIKEILLVEGEETNLQIGHYTSLETINSIIKDETTLKDAEKPFLRLTNINQLNDPLEGKVLSQYLDIDSTSISHIYVSCATTSRDSLPMWNMYANKATGVFVIYDQDFLKKIIEDDSIDLYHVCYINIDDDNRDKLILSIPSIKNQKKREQKEKEIETCIQDIKEALSKLNDKDETTQIFENISFLFKELGYAYEEEIRFCISPLSKEISPVTKEGNQFPMLYSSYTKHRLRYSEVVLGPKAEIPLGYIAPYLDLISERNQCQSIRTSKSKRHFR